MGVVIADAEHLINGMSALAQAAAIVITAILTILWILIPFILLDIKKQNQRLVDAMLKSVRSTDTTTKRLEAISQQIDFLVQAKAAEQNQERQMRAVPSRH